MRCLVIVLLAITATLAEVHYDGYKTYRVTPTTIEQANSLKTLEKLFELDFWSTLRSLNKPVDVMVKPKFQSSFEYMLHMHNIKYETLIEDVERQIQKSKLMEKLLPKNKSARFDLTRFHTHAEMNAYLDDLARAHPDIVSLETLGNSYEGREMKAIKISSGGNRNKPVIFVDGGIHAREWAASAEALCIISALVEDSRNQNLIENVDWYILPLVNPDGFEYSRNKDQMWRKTRSRGTRCYGADPNRNFDFHWMEVGADSDECSIVYGGKKAFSEVESRNVANFAAKYKDNIKLYLTFHSYGQYILYPWGYTSAYPENVEELDSLGHKVDEAISKVYGTRYTVGSSTNTLYPAAGGSDDWVKGVAGVPLAYTIELPAGGNSGFDLPPSRLNEVCTETFEGIKAFHKHIEDNYA